MAVTLVAAAAAQVAGVTTPAAVAGITPTVTAVALATHPKQRVFVYQSHSCETGSASTPSDWNSSYKDVVVGTGTASAAAGRRFISCYWRDWDGVWTMPSFDLASATQNSHAIATLTVTCDPTEDFDTPTFSGDGEYFGTAGTAFSAATPAAFNAVTKAFLMLHAVTNDNVTATTGALTGSGFTSGTVTERADSGTATGNDVSIKLHTCVPTTGANVALTHTMTLSAASQGGWAVVQQTATYTGSTPSGAFVYDTFRDADGVTAHAHTGELGATWAKQTGTGTGGADAPHQNNRVWGAGANYVASATPPGANYEVKADITIVSALNNAQTLISGRTVSNAFTEYAAILYLFSGTYYLYLRRLSAAASLDLGGSPIALTGGAIPTVGSTHELMLRLDGSSLSVYWDGVLKVGPSTNSDITAAGLVGFGSTAGSATTGFHIGNITANPYPNATDYVPSITPEAVGITDSLTKEAGRVATDAVGITDSATFLQSFAFTADATDLVGITDSLPKEAGKTATDLVGVTDSVSVQQDWVRSQTDPVGVTDSAAFGLDYVTVATDAVGITDSFTAAQGFDRSATDLVGVSDSISVQQDWVRAQTDLVGITDTSVKDSGRTVTDLVGITDSAAVQQDRSVSATDPVGLLDSLTKDAGRSATDAVGVTDAASVQQGWSRTQTDLVGIADSSVLGQGRLITDPLNITDALSLTQAWVRSQTDLVGITDSGSFDLAGAGNFTDTDQVGVTDALGTAFDAVRPLADLVGISDSGLFQVGSVVSAADSVGITDLLAFTAAYERSWTDPVGVADSASFDLSSVGDIVESDLVGVADSADIVAGYERSFTDPVGVVDDAQFQLDAAAAEVVDATDLVGVVDAAFFAIRIPPGPDNSWVPRAESVIHTVVVSANSQAAPSEFTRFAPRIESNTYAVRAESTHVEVAG